MVSVVGRPGTGRPSRPGPSCVPHCTCSSSGQAAQAITAAVRPSPGGCAPAGNGPYAATTVATTTAAAHGRVKARTAMSLRPARPSHRARPHLRTRSDHESGEWVKFAVPWHRGRMTSPYASGRRHRRRRPADRLLPGRRAGAARLPGAVRPGVGNRLGARDRGAVASRCAEPGRAADRGDRPRRAVGTRLPARRLRAGGRTRQRTHPAGRSCGGRAARGVPDARRGRGRRGRPARPRRRSRLRAERPGVRLLHRRPGQPDRPLPAGRRRTPAGHPRRDRQEHLPQRRPAGVRAGRHAVRRHRRRG